MNRILDSADRAYRWLSHHVAAAAALVLGVVALLVVAFLVTGGDDDGAGGKVPAGSVAVVGDTRITQADLTRWKAIYSRAVSDTAKPTDAQARDQAFALLAGSAWITEEAKRTGVTATPAQVTTSIDGYFKAAGATTTAARTQLLGQLGVGESELRFQQRVSLLSNGLRARAVKAVAPPSDAAVKQAYEREPARWATPTQRDIRVVVAGTQQTAQQAHDALAGGASFASVLKRYSSDSSLAQSKGVVKGLKPGTNDPALERAVFSAPQGQLTGPVRVQGGYMVFKVQKVTAQPAQSLAQATKLIRANLLGVAQQQATQTFLADLRKRWKAKTTCGPEVAQTSFCPS